MRQTDKKEQGLAKPLADRGASTGHPSQQVACRLAPRPRQPQWILKEEPEGGFR